VAPVDQVRGVKPLAAQDGSATPGILRRIRITDDREIRSGGESASGGAGIDLVMGASGRGAAWVLLHPCGTSAAAGLAALADPPSGAARAPGVGLLCRSFGEMKRSNLVAHFTKL
jgi:hypothetical protein